MLIYNQSILTRLFSKFGGDTIKENEFTKAKNELDKRSALNEFRKKIIFRYLVLFLVITFGFLLLVYGASSFGSEGNIFTIKVGNGSLSKLSSNSDFSHLISLSEDSNFTNPLTNLSFNGVHNLTNISRLDIPDDIDLESDGEHNGKNYLAYTFYLKNVEEESKVTESIYIKGVFRNMDEAIRIRIYRNGLEREYAKENKNGECEYNTECFLNSETVYQRSYSLLSNEIVKYTIVIWLEGDDPDCTNSLYGGMIKLGMEFIVDEE